MAETQWTVGAQEGQERLDKFLAAGARLGSRGRATTALGRGQVFLNGAEAGLADAGRRLV